MGATESWVHVREDGSIVLHTENDGARFLRRGPEAINEIVTLEELRRYPQLFKDAEAQLARLAQLKKLRVEEETALSSLIDTSITSRYAGELEQQDEWDGGCTYAPLDTDQIRELLVQLWGETLTQETIEAAFTRLTEEGTDSTDNWPDAWCEEEDRLSDYHTEKDEARDWVEAVMRGELSAEI